MYVVILFTTKLYFKYLLEIVNLLDYCTWDIPSVKILSIFQCLELFPGLSRAGYERIPDISCDPTLPILNEAVNANARNLDDSWSSERERDFRIQNGMSSTRTSTASHKNDLGEYLVIKKSEHQELVDKTEKLKNGVLELLDSFNAFISKLDPIDKLVEMESGTMND